MQEGPAQAPSGGSASFERQFIESDFWARFAKTNLRTAPDADGKHACSSATIIEPKSTNATERFQRFLQWLGDRAFDVINSFNRQERQNHPVSVKFWVSFIESTANYSLMATAINISFMTGALGTILRRAEQPLSWTFILINSNQDQYTGTSVFLCIWITINATIFFTVVGFKYFRNLFKGLSDSYIVRIWNGVGDFVLLSRLLVMIVQIRNVGLLQPLPRLNVAFDGSLATPSDTLFIQPLIANLILNVFQTMMLTSYPFPWPWALILCGLQLIEEALFLLVVSSHWIDLPNHILVEFSIYAVAAFILVPFQAGAFVFHSMELYRLSARHEDGRLQKRRLVETLCSEVRLPLQYMSSAVESLPYEQLSPEHKRSVGHMINNHRTVNNLVDSIFTLMKIDENRFQVGTAVKPVRLHSFVAQDILGQHQFKSDAELTKELELVIPHSLVAHMDEHGLSEILKNLICHARIMIDAVLATEAHAINQNMRAGSQRVSNEPRKEPRAVTLQIQCRHESASHSLQRKASSLVIQLTSNFPTTIQIDLNSSHIVTARAVVHLLQGSFSPEVNSNRIEIVLPCSQPDLKHINDDGPQGTQGSRRNRSHRIEQMSDGAGGGGGASAHDLSSEISTSTHEGSVSSDNATIKVAILSEEEGIESCVVALLEKSKHIRYATLDQRTLLRGQSRGSFLGDIIDTQLFEGDADVVFASKVDTCIALRSAGFKGKIIICSSSLPYLDVQQVATCCDYMLSIPTAPADVAGTLAFIDKSKMTTSSEGRHLSTMDATAKVNRSYAPADLATLIGSTISLLSIPKALSAFKFFIVGEFVSSNDESPNGLLLSRHLDYLPHSVLGLRVFELRVEKNYYLWRFLNVNWRLGEMDRLSLLIQAALKLYFDVLGEHSTLLVSVSYLFLLTMLLFREYAFKTVFSIWQFIKFSPESAFYIAWKIGMIAASFMTLAGVPAFIASYDQQRLRGEIPTMVDFILASFGSITGTQIIVQMVFVIQLNAQWAELFPWPTNVLFAVVVICRQIIFVLFLRVYVDSLLLGITVMLFSQYLLFMVISMYRSETMGRAHFRMYRKMAHSDMFMDQVIAGLIAGIEKPLAKLADDNRIVVSILESCIATKTVATSKSLLHNWKLYKFGRLVADGLSAQLKYRKLLSQSSMDSNSKDVGCRALMLQSVILENEICNSISYIQELTFSNRYNLEVTVKVDRRLIIVKVDQVLLKTMLGQALSTACRNIQRESQRLSTEQLSIHHIHVRVSIHSDFLPQSQSAHGHRLKFVDPRLLVVEVLDTGMMEAMGDGLQTPETGDLQHELVASGRHLGLGVGWEACNDILIRSAAALSPQLGPKSSYSIQRLEHPMVPYHCCQKFTIPYKLEQATSVLAGDALMSRLKSVPAHVSRNYDRFLGNLDRWRASLQANRPPPSNLVPSLILDPESNLRAQYCPLMVLVYERPPALRGVLMPQSPYYQCMLAFRLRNWRYKVIFDLSLPESAEVLKQASCVVVDNCAYNQPSSSSSSVAISLGDAYAWPSEEAIGGGCLFEAQRKNISAATYLKAMGYTLITVGMFSAGSSALAPSLRANYDVTLFEPITQGDLVRLTTLLEGRMMPLLLKLQLSSS